MSKKNTKAGIRKCSAAVRQDSRAISETSTWLPVFGARHQCREIVGRMGDVGVGEPEKFRRELGRAVARPAASPRACRSSPAAAAPPVSTVSRSIVQRARQIAGAVVGLVVHQDDAEVARIILRQQTADAVLNHIGFVAGRHHRDDRRPARPALALASCRARAAARSRRGPAADKARSPAAESRTTCPRSFADIRWRANQARASVKPFAIGPRRIAQFALGLGGGEEHADSATCAAHRR